MQDVIDGPAEGTLRRAWRNRPFRRLLASSAISGSGDWLYGVALFAFLLDETGSAGWVGAAATVRLLPYVLLGPVGGAIAARFDRRRVMVATDLSRAAVMAAMAVVVAADGPPALVIALTAIASCGATAYRPATVAFTPDVVDEDDLAAANAAESVVGQLTWLVGPLLGSVVLAVSSPAVAIGLNALTFLASAAFIAGVRPRADRAAIAAADDDEELGSAWAELTRGWRVIRGDTGLFLLTALVTLVAGAFGLELVLQVLVAEERLDLGPGGLGYLIGAVGVGGLLAAPLSGRIGSTKRPGAALAVSAVLMGLPLAAMAVVTVPWVAYLVLLVEGAGNIVFEVLAVTLLQRLVRGGELARVFGFQDSLGAGAQLAGAAAAPILVAVVGLEATLVVTGALLAGLALVLLPRLAGVGIPDRALTVRVESLSGLALFAGSSDAAVERVAGALSEETVAAGTVVLAQGDEPDDLFVVRDGSFAVRTSRQSRVQLRSLPALGPGDWFGEIGLVLGVPRTATVTALTDAVVWRVPGDAFLEAVDTPAVAGEPWRRGMTARVARTHPHLARSLGVPPEAEGG